MFDRDAEKELQQKFIEDLMHHPTKFGAPTFEQFKRNRDQYVKTENHILEQVEKGSTLLRSRIKKYKFQVFESKCDTLEKAEQLIREYGYKPSQLDMVPELIPQNSYDCDMLVKFVLKEAI